MVNEQNRAWLNVVARGISKTDHKVVFVGGAVVGLYGNDPARAAARLTKDVDVVAEILNLSDNDHFETRLREIGFQPDRYSSIICRYKY